MEYLPHHAATIDKVIAHFAPLPEVEAILLAGSIAHGFARPQSDVDIMVVVDSAHYAERVARSELTLYDPTLSTYEGGYVDGKFVDQAFIRDVAARGSDAARYAFKDAQILHSRVEGLPALLAAAARFPAELASARRDRFLAQFEAWHWYAHEALAQRNPYLCALANSKLALFGARLILNEQQRLFPFHKWLRRELECCADIPDDLLERFDALFTSPGKPAVDAFYATIKAFRDWPQAAQPWPMQFMQDSELNWRHGFTPVDDL
ncbi:nucleotidyltransferase domain-containing protein [Niveibacterium microcysteis]|uniref:Nucleotidyltransferase domain-containing protein n=1 Tax=Niveibacterium microcysteis TaxID=2811415 RepID=A0ABX7M4R5_9RHOO|nr:nucleotidyltransferase domain-containing protein [Niveibacterium microcysteis]QSI76745.1 nucleotidyltransferase domain-containing protein [Niveibacterium microcysteis]